MRVRMEGDRGEIPCHMHRFQRRMSGGEYQHGLQLAGAFSSDDPGIVPRSVLSFVCCLVFLVDPPRVHAVCTALRNAGAQVIDARIDWEGVVLRSS